MRECSEDLILEVEVVNSIANLDSGEGYEYNAAAKRYILDQGITFIQLYYQY